VTFKAAPLKTALSDTYPNPSNAVMRTGMGALWDWATSLLGTTGDPSDARTALGAAATTVGIPQNLSLNVSAAGSALNVSIKGMDGSDPSASNPVKVPFRNVTASAGDYTFLTLTSATSLTISSGSTLGTLNTWAFRVWIVAFNDAGTLRLGAINCLSGTNIYPLGQFGIASSTAEGGAGGADSAQVFYTGTAVTSKAYTVLGYFSYESGLATAGTWSGAPTRLQLFNSSVPLPGASIQRLRAQTGAIGSGSGTIPYDDTIPQNTEGVSFAGLGLDLTISPASAANVLHINANFNLSNSAGGVVGLALFRDSGADAIAASADYNGISDSIMQIPLGHAVLAGSTSSTAFKLRAGGHLAGTTYINGRSGSRTYGGVMASFHEVREIMA